MKKLLNVPKSLFSMLIISYIGIFSLSLIAGTAMIISSYSHSKKKTYAYNSAVVDKFRETIDPLLLQVITLGNNIENDMELISARSGMPVTPSNHADMLEVLKQIDNQITVDSYIYNAFIYFPDSDVIASTSFEKSEDFFNESSAYENYTFSQWESKFLKKRHYAQFYPCETIVKGAHRNRVITYAHTLSSSAAGENGTTLILQIDAERLINEVFFREISAESSLYILDKTKNVMLSINYDEVDVKSVPYIDLTGEGVVEADNGKSVLFTTSSYERWIYAVAIPKEVFFGDVTPMRNYFIFIMVIYILTAVIIGFVSMHNHYNFFHIMSDKLGVSGVNSVRMLPKTADIVSGIDNLLENNSKLMRSNLSKEEIIRNNVINAIVLGNVEPDDVKGELNSVGIRFNHDLFRIINVYTEEAGNLAVGDEKEYLANTAIMNIYGELLNKYFSAIMFKTDKEHVCALINLENSEGADETITEISHILEDVLMNEFDMSVAIGISTVKESVQSLHTLYEESVMSLDYKSASNISKIIFYKDIVNDDKRNFNLYYYPTEIEAKIINYTVSGQAEQLEETLNEIIDININNALMSTKSISCFYYDLLGTYMKICDMLKFEASEQLMRFAEIKDDRTVIKSKTEALRRGFAEVCEYTQKTNSDNSDNFIESVKEYVYENYADCSMGVATIAEHFGITRQTLSKKFNQNGEVKLVDFIGEVRVTKAKELLENTNLKVSQVAMLVGYADNNTFNRVYKKYFGITPGKHKNIY